MTRTGSCVCGQIAFSTTHNLRSVTACHCTQCRKATGNYVAATSAPRDAIAIDGSVTWFQSSPKARRGFCPTCGSNLFWDGPGANLSIMAGVLDQPTGLSMEGHIYCAQKGDWYEIADGTPQAPGADADMTTQVNI